LHRAIGAQEATHQLLARTLAAQVFQQRQQGALAVVEHDVVEEIEDARLGEFAQLGVHEAAAQHGDNLRVARLDRLGDAEGAIDIAREGRGEQHHLRRMARHGGQRQFAQRGVDQVLRRRQRLRQRLEAGLALRQRFGIAHELEARVDRFAQHVGDVVEVKRGEVAGAVGHAQRAEGPGQRIAALVVDIHVERGEARALGQEGTAGDAVRERRIAPLEEGHGNIDAWPGSPRSAPGRRPRAACGFAGSAFGDLADRLQARRREQAQHQRQRQVFLHRGYPARTQETGQVGGGRIGRVELRHRRDEREHARRHDG
jgi:hypothetical protein